MRRKQNWMPLILGVWWLLMMPPVNSQESDPPPLSEAEMDLAKQYGIDPQEKYPGYSVVRALSLQLQEAEKELIPRLEIAWNDGYAEAAREWKPRALGAEAGVLEAKKIIHDQGERIGSLTFWGRVKTLAIAALASTTLLLMICPQ